MLYRPAKFGGKPSRAGTDDTRDPPLELSFLAVPQVFVLKAVLPTFQSVGGLQPHAGPRQCLLLVQAGKKANAKRCAGQVQNTLRLFTLASQAGMMCSQGQRMPQNLSLSQRSSSLSRSKCMDADTL